MPNKVSNGFICGQSFKMAIVIFYSTILSSGLLTVAIPIQLGFPNIRQAFLANF
jgi:hypothetical protein